MSTQYIYSDLFLMIMFTTAFKALLPTEIVAKQRAIKMACLGCYYIFMVLNMMSNFRLGIIHAKQYLETCSQVTSIIFAMLCEVFLGWHKETEPIKTQIYPHFLHISYPQWREGIKGIAWSNLSTIFIQNGIWGKFLTLCFSKVCGTYFASCEQTNLLQSCCVCGRCLLTWPGIPAHVDRNSCSQEGWKSWVWAGIRSWLCWWHSTVSADWKELSFPD